MQHRETKVAVREGIGAVLQPDNYGVKLADGTNQRVIDVVKYRYTGDCKTHCGIDGVGESHDSPSGIVDPCPLLELAFIAFSLS